MAAKGQMIQCYVSGQMVDAAGLIRDVLPQALDYGGRTAEPGIAARHTEPAPAPAPTVFVSYAWTDESSALVDRLQSALQEHGIRLLRDREEVRYKDSIRNFMHDIGKGKAVVVVMSEKYLKSKNCMFEMLEIAQAGAFRERIFPIVLRDSNLYEPIGLVEYVLYWEELIQKLDAGLKRVRGDNLTNLHKELDLYSEIRRMFDTITDTLRDMNALTPDQHEGSGFEELIRRIRAQTGSSG
jgi:hypothetical protein